MGPSLWNTFCHKITPECTFEALLDGLEVFSVVFPLPEEEKAMTMYVRSIKRKTQSVAG